MPLHLLFSSRHPVTRYALAVGSCLLTAIITLPLRGLFDLANIVILFLLTVFVVAARLGRGPAILTAFLSVALFDVFFVPPHLSFSVVDAQYLVTFAVMLAVGLITSHLAAQLGERTEESQAREHETRMLFELARELGTAVTLEQVTETLTAFLDKLGMTMALRLDEGLGGKSQLVTHGALKLSPDATELSGVCYRDNARLEQAGMLFLPLPGTTRLRGVLVCQAQPGRSTAIAPQFFSAVASLTGIAVERLHYAAVAQRSELEMQAEKLRSSLLASISHDLRTPLTSLVGQADVLASERTEASAGVAEKAAIIRDQAHAMHRMVSNLLDMARLQSGRITLNQQWQTFDDIVGSSVRLLDGILAGHPLYIELPSDLPLVKFDAVLMERVVCNLLENAAKHSAPAAAIRLSATTEADMLVVSICNDGATFPADHTDALFELFARGEKESSTPGTGIGLAVCRAIITAHGGTITAENLADRACVRFSLPLGNAPTGLPELESEPA